MKTQLKTQVSDFFIGLIYSHSYYTTHLYEKHTDVHLIDNFKTKLIITIIYAVYTSWILVVCDYE
jgi:hypothetical protein